MPDSLATWIKRISDQELPIFKYTVSAITDVVANEDTSTAKLAQIILRDASLTARILRVANSTIYNPTSSPINTVTRAIVFIGFDLVRDISLSLAVIDALLGDNVREHTSKLMAESFHAAVQAQRLAEHRGDNNPEEIFISALLHHLGEMAFWCLTTDEGKKIIELMDQFHFKPDMAQKEVLGFTFDQLTVGLTKDWHLGDLIHSSINQPTLSNPRVQDIVMSHTLAKHAAISWESKQTKAIINKIAGHLKSETVKTKQLLQETAKQAAEIAQLFGASSIIKHLPIPQANDYNGSAAEQLIPDEYPEPDPLLQLNILRDLSGILENQSNPNLNIILETILEGIYRGIGMDRTLFALLSSDKKSVAGKYALGKDNIRLAETFRFDIGKNALLQTVFNNNKPLWVKDSQDKKYAALVGKEMRHLLGSKAFFISPVVINNNPIGIIYSDRQASDRPLDQESFDSFRHFCQQNNLLLERVTPRQG